MDEAAALADTPGLHCHAPRVGFSDREEDRAKFGCGRGRVTTLGKSVYPESLQSSAKSVSREPVHWYSSAGEGTQGARRPQAEPQAASRTLPHAPPRRASELRAGSPARSPPLRPARRRTA